jgi:hypothetical protein
MIAANRQNAQKSVGIGPQMPAFIDVTSRGEVALPLSGSKGLFSPEQTQFCTTFNQ